MFRRARHAANLTRVGRGRSLARNRRQTIGSFPFQRRLRVEPLEDRRLLSITVNTLVDENDGIGVGGISLRDAIAAAPPGETIDFSVTGTINLTNLGELTINRNLTINGPGAHLLTINAFDPTSAINNGDGSRVFNIDDGTGTVHTVSISGLALTGGGASLHGGAIFSREQLSVINCAISGNSAGGSGGGIASLNSNLTVVGSTVSGNTASVTGGGIDIRYGNLTATSITVSGNSTTAFFSAGGGIFSVGGLGVNHSTITGNSAGSNGGGGIYNVGAALLNHTIVAGNTHSGAIPDDVFGPAAASSAYNLIGVDTNLTGISNGTNGNQIGTSGTPINPQLGPLANNGGRTMTHALLAGSPATDAGDPSFSSPPNFDQRGAPFGRVFDGNGAGGAQIDIGAFELQPVGPALPGDYNLDKTVNAGDYVWWRKTLDTTGVPAYSGADGDGDTTIDQDDYDVWSENFGSEVNDPPVDPNESFTVQPNVGIIVDAANGLLMGATDPNAGDTLSVTAGAFPTTAGGSITIAADGSFTYIPQAGDKSLADTYTYTVSDGHGGTDTSTVTFNLNGDLIWFVDLSAATGGAGTVASPFDSLLDLDDSVTDPDLDGETIFVYRTTAGAVNHDLGAQDFDFQPNQLLIGEGLTGGAGDDINDVRGFTTQTHSLTLPTINGDQHSIVTNNSNALTLSTENTIRGLDVGNTGTGTKIINGGGTVGSLTIDDVNLSGTGMAIDIDQGGALNVTIDSLTSTSSAAQGVQLAATGTALTGTFTATMGAIDGSAGAAFLVGDGAGGANTGGTATISFGGTITSGAGRAVDIQDRPAGAGNITFSGNITHNVGGQTGVFLDDNFAGTILFSGQSQSFTSTTATAVSLTDNTGSTVNFNPTAGGNGLDITTTSGTGFLATGGGTGIVQGSGNTISSTTGTALNVVNTTIGASGLNFVSINSNTASSNVAINLNNTGTSGGLAVTGNGVAGDVVESSAGGTIANKSANAIVLSNTAGVRLNDMIIGANAATAGEGQPNTTSNIGGDGIVTTSVVPVVGGNYGLLLDNVTISQTGGNGINGTGGNNNGLRVNRSRFLNIGNDLVTTSESAIAYGTGFPSTDQITGTVHIDDSTFAGFTGYGFTVENAGNGTLNMTVEDSVFKNNDSTTIGNSGIQYIGDGSSSVNNPKLNLLVEDTTFTNIDLDGIEVTTDPGSTSNVTIRRTTYSNPNGDNAIHMVAGSIDADDVETMNVWIEDTTVTSQRGTLIFLKSGAGTYNATVTSTVGFGGKLDSGLNVDGGSAHIGRGIEILFDAENGDTISAKVLIEKQTLRNIGVDGIHIASNRTIAGTTIDATFKNNIIGEVGAETGRQGTGEGIEVKAGGSPTTSDGVMNILADANTIRMRNPGAANPGMEGIDLDAEAGYTLNATITANNFNNPANTGENLSADTEAGGSPELHLDIRSNISTTGNDPDYILTQSAGIFRVKGAGTGAVTAAAIQAAQTSGTASVAGTVLFNNDAAISLPGTPTTPTLPPAPPASLSALEVGSGQETNLTNGELIGVVSAAIERLASIGASAAQLALLNSVSFQIVDLAGAQLGSAGTDFMQIDINGAGWGYFVDDSPLDDSEFELLAAGGGLQAAKDSAAYERIDLLSVVLHELGHILGHDHDDEEGLMGATLETGVRHTDLDAVFADETALAALFS